MTVAAVVLAATPIVLAYVAGLAYVTGGDTYSTFRYRQPLTHNTN